MSHPSFRRTLNLSISLLLNLMIVKLSEAIPNYYQPNYYQQQQQTQNNYQSRSVHNGVSRQQPSNYNNYEQPQQYNNNINNHNNNRNQQQLNNNGYGNNNPSYQNNQYQNNRNQLQQNNIPSYQNNLNQHPNNGMNNNHNNRNQHQQNTNPSYQNNLNQYPNNAMSNNHNKGNQHQQNDLNQYSNNAMSNVYNNNRNQPQQNNNPSHQDNSNPNAIPNNQQNNQETPSKGSSLENRVSNGRIAPPHPYQVQILSKNSFICGGALIDEEWVLTAAHCLKGKSNFEILVGTTLLKQTGGEGQRIKVAKSIPHPKYDSIRLSNDIGLMKLEKPAKIGEHVHPVALGSADEAAAGVKAHVAGWGQTEKSQVSHILMETEQKIVTREECKRAWDKTDHTHICTREVYKDSWTCPGDSGSPLTIGKGDETRVIGVVSFGAPGCPAAGNKPEVYTNVGSHTPWIKSVTGKNFGTESDSSDNHEESGGNYEGTTDAIAENNPNTEAEQGDRENSGGLIYLLNHQAMNPVVWELWQAVNRRRHGTYTGYGNRPFGGSKDEGRGNILEQLGRDQARNEGYSGSSNAYNSMTNSYSRPGRSEYAETTYMPNNAYGSSNAYRPFGQSNIQGQQTFPTQNYQTEYSRPSQYNYYYG